MSKSRLSRREFLSHSSVAVAAVGTGVSFPSTGWASETEKKEPEKGYRVLGRTGLVVSQIAFGGLQIDTPALLNAAIDKGINLIHLARGYRRGKTMKIYGEVMKTRRDEVILALKEDPTRGIDESLKALHTDHVDILVPGLHSVNAIRNPRLSEAFEKLKKQGKIRFSGFAAHKNVADVVAGSIGMGCYDVMIPDYNLNNCEQLNPFLEKAKREQNMGVMPMKTLKRIGRDPENVKKAYAQYLSNRNIDTLLVGMGSFDDLNVNLEACFKKYAAASSEDLDQSIRYADANECSACGACGICPNGVEVCDIMRFEYYLSRGEPELARASYNELRPGQRADHCQACGQCTEVCPKSIDIPARLREIHAALTAFA